MIHDNIEFWNAAELTSEAYQSGLRIQRFPETVRAALAANPNGMVVGRKPTAKFWTTLLPRSDPRPSSGSPPGT